MAAKARTKTRTSTRKTSTRKGSTTTHKKIRCNCVNCGKGHHAKQHQSHGLGSFKAIHPGYCRKFKCHDPGTKLYKRKKRQVGCNTTVKRKVSTKKRRTTRRKTTSRR